MEYAPFLSGISGVYSRNYRSLAVTAAATRSSAATLFRRVFAALFLIGVVCFVKTRAFELDVDVV